MPRKLPAKKPAKKKGKSPFRFFDNREKYLMFVTTCSEKWQVAARMAQELRHVKPSPPALRVLDAGMGDGTVLTRTMRAMHSMFPTIPFLVVGKEISLEDVRLSIEKMVDRFHEHPHTVFVATNLYYYEVAGLTPRHSPPADFNWQEIELEGSTTHEFDAQISDQLQPILSAGWRTRTSEKTGNPLYVNPSVVVIYRKDHRFALDSVIPRRGEAQEFDFVMASQPYQARLPAEVKSRNVLRPLARALAPGGRMVTVQSTGKDPGMDIVGSVWPEENPFQTPRRMLLDVLRSEMKAERRNLRYFPYTDSRSQFRYELHTLLSEISSNIGTSTLLAAWNAAVYVAQIDDDKLMKALRKPAIWRRRKKFCAPMMASGSPINSSPWRAAGTEGTRCRDCCRITAIRLFSGERRLLSARRSPPPIAAPGRHGDGQGAKHRSRARTGWRPAIDLAATSRGTPPAHFGRASRPPHRRS